MLVTTVKTTPTIPNFIKSVIVSYNKMYNTVPSKEAVGILFSQWSIETGQGKNCYNWNLGNVKYVQANGDVPYMALSGVWEIVNGIRIEIPITNPGAWFRSFEVLDEGMEFYLGFIKNGRYASAWPCMQAGDVAGYAHQLRLHGYYTASEASYVA